MTSTLAMTTTKEMCIFRKQIQRISSELITFIPKRKIVRGLNGREKALVICQTRQHASFN